MDSFKKIGKLEAEISKLEIKIKEKSQFFQLILLSLR